MAFIAGAYNVTITDANKDLGQLQDGVTLTFRRYYEEVRGDNFAQGVQELITRGLDCFMDMVLLEFDAEGAIFAYWPEGGLDFGATGIPGRVVTTDIGPTPRLASSLTLGAIAGTTAAENILSLGVFSAILAPGFDVSLLFAPRLRIVPLRLQLFPNQSRYYFSIA